MLRTPLHHPPCRGPHSLNQKLGNGFVPDILILIGQVGSAVEAPPLPMVGGGWVYREGRLGLLSPTPSDSEAVLDAAGGDQLIHRGCDPG